MNNADLVDDDLMEAEDDLARSDESDETPPSDIVAFNELRSCADLYRMYVAKQLDIQPDFQREIVWPVSDQTRFIDSLAKQLPIPSMCISLDYKTDKRQVVDGLQRMASIVKFLSESDWRLSNLDDVDKKISNKTVEYIKKEQNSIYTRIENTTIPVTILRCDLSKRNHQEYLFTIFHRLNKGGLKLTNQEIRNCIYSGNFNNLLKEIVAEKLYSSLFEIDSNKKYRYSNEELLLRVFAFSESHDSYKGPLSKFLNDCMSKARKYDDQKLRKIRSKLQKSLEILYVRILDSEPLPRLSRATTEAILVGIIRNLKKIENATDNKIKSSFQALRADPLFSIDALKEGLAATDKVKARLDRSVALFNIK